MRIRSVGYAFCVCATAAFLSACGGMQPPVAAPGAVPQISALAARQNGKDYTVVYSFGHTPDGARPFAGLIDVGGTLYGTTFAGGAYGYPFSEGTVFSITPSGSEKVLYSFRGHRITGPHDGAEPAAALIEVKDKLYGTTLSGGTETNYSYYGGRGTVFSITPSGMEKVLHTFGTRDDGINPAASLIDVNGTLYGTTLHGGKYNKGTVFSITPSGTEKVLHTFRYNADGCTPGASLIEVKGKLYGTTEACGAYGGGTVFRMALSGGRVKVLHSFGRGGDGNGPAASLLDVNGTLYGTTLYGGKYNEGTVFSITPSGTEKVLHSFGNGFDGFDPTAALIKVKGVLYGTTQYGGYYGCHNARNCGTVFSITLSGREKVLRSFGRGNDGTYPVAALTDVDGVLYGTTMDGGRHGRGTVFALTP